MEKFDDISNLTYLNEASVLHNLRSRYQAKLIYVRLYSILCIFSESLNSDLLRSVLCRRQSVQEISDLHQDCRQALPGQEEERGTSSSIRHLGWSLQEHVEE